jgi:hypothetical protein
MMAMNYDDLWEQLNKMGNMKTWWIFGFEPWGGLRPAKMWTAGGRCFRPVMWGLWIRCDNDS